VIQKDGKLLYYVLRRAATPHTEEERMSAHTKEPWTAKGIRTRDFGVLPIAKDTTYVNDECVGTVETCDGKFYEVRRAFSGALVATDALNGRR
jgi:hypothetical protein